MQSAALSEHESVIRKPFSSSLWTRQHPGAAPSPVYEGLHRRAQHGGGRGGGRPSVRQKSCFFSEIRFQLCFLPFMSMSGKGNHKCFPSVFLSYGSVSWSLLLGHP